MTEKQKEVRKILRKMDACCLYLKASNTPACQRTEYARQLRVQAKMILGIPIEDLDIFQEVD